MSEVVRVVAAVTCYENWVLCFRRSQGKSAGGRWEFPGGKIEKGESRRTALRREIWEETGKVPTVGRLILQKSTNVGSKTIDISFFHTSFSIPAGIPTSSSDHDLIKWVHKTQLAELKWAAPDLPMVKRIQQPQNRHQLGKKSQSLVLRTGPFARQLVELEARWPQKLPSFRTSGRSIDSQ